MLCSMHPSVPRLPDSAVQCFAFMAIMAGGDASGDSSAPTWGVARTASFTLPPRIIRLMRGEGGQPPMELGDADDAVFKTVNSKQKGGSKLPDPAVTSPHFHGANVTAYDITHRSGCKAYQGRHRSHDLLRAHTQLGARSVLAWRLKPLLAPLIPMQSSRNANSTRAQLQRGSARRRGARAAPSAPGTACHTAREQSAEMMLPT
jgi:hypothetical protein